MVLGVNILLFTKNPFSRWEKSLFNPIKSSPLFYKASYHSKHVHLAYGGSSWIIAHRIRTSLLTRPMKILRSTSPDGLWDKVYSKYEVYIRDIAYAKGQWLAIGIDNKANEGLIQRAKENSITSWEIDKFFRYPDYALYSFSSLAYGDGYWLIGSERYSTSCVLPGGIISVGPTISL